MTEKKFNVVLTVMAAAAFVMGAIIAFPVEGVVLGAVTLGICLKKREEYRVLIPCIISIAGIVLGLGFLAFLIWTNLGTGIGETDYWFIKLLSGMVK